MRVLHDQLAKGLLEVALEARGRVLMEHEVRAEPSRADVGFIPVRPWHDERDLGLLGRMAEERSLFEAEHNTPTIATVLGAVRRQLTWWQVLRTEAPRGARVPLPFLWVLSSGRPRRALAELGFLPKKGWPNGVFAAPVGTRAHLVVLSELSRERSTLVLRLMGRGATLRAAMEDLGALPSETWEQFGVIPLLKRFAIDAAMAPASVETEDLVGKYSDMAREYNELLRAEGRAAGLAEGRAEGLTRMFERKLGRTLTSDDHTALRQKLDAVGPDRLGDMVLDLSGDQLARWLADPAAR